jgi:hypothetical protein
VTRIRFADLPATQVAKLPDPLESDWTTWVIHQARRNGWRAHHARPARTTNGWRTAVEGDKGAPDLLLARAGEVLVWEAKRNRTYPDPDQRAWLAELGDHGAVVRPRDAEQVLARLTRVKAVTA